MDGLMRLITSLAIGAALVLALFFFTTIGLVIAGIVGVGLLIGALTGRKRESGSFRVIRFGHVRDVTPPGPDNGEAQRLGDGAPRQDSAGQGAGNEEIVDIPPEDYRTMESPAADTAARASADGEQTRQG